MALRNNISGRMRGMLTRKKKGDRNYIRNAWVVFVWFTVQRPAAVAVKWEPLSTGWLRSRARLGQCRSAAYRVAD